MLWVGRQIIPELGYQRQGSNLWRLLNHTVRARESVWVLQILKAIDLAVIGLLPTEIPQT
jgi:uncharacterized protein YjiS (DUF1127 family)